MSCREVLAGPPFLGWEGGNGIAFAPVAGRLDVLFWMVWSPFSGLGRDGCFFFTHLFGLASPSLLSIGLLGGDRVLGWTGSNK